MNEFYEKISNKIKVGKVLFYNSTGDVKAYQLGVKHLSASLYLGFCTQIQETLYVQKEFYLVDFEDQHIRSVEINEKLTLIPLR